MLSRKKKEEAGFDDSDDEGSVSMTATSAFQRNDILVCSTYGKIYAIHKRNGSRLWRTKMSSMASVVSVFITDYDRLIAAGYGKTACLDLFTGQILWTNNMKGCGYEEVGVIGTPTRILKPDQPQNTQTQEDPSLPAYEEDEHSGVLDAEKPVIIACTNGKCMGIDAESGQDLWLFKCPKGGFKIPSAIVDPPTEFHRQQNVYVGCGKMIYCLEARSGDLQWSTQISNAIMGQGYMTLTTPWSSRLAAEAHTAFSQFPSAQQESIARQTRRNASN